jgi:hypothetical protein
MRRIHDFFKRRKLVENWEQPTNFAIGQCLYSDPECHSWPNPTSGELEVRIGDRPAVISLTTFRMGKKESETTMDHTKHLLELLDKRSNPVQIHYQKYVDKNKEYYYVELSWYETRWTQQRYHQYKSCKATFERQRIF